MAKKGRKAKKSDEPLVIPLAFEDAVRHVFSAPPVPKAPRKPAKKAKKR